MNTQDLETCKTEGRFSGFNSLEQSKPFPAAHNKTVMALIEKHGKGAPVGTCLPLLKAYCEAYDAARIEMVEALTNYDVEQSDLTSAEKLRLDRMLQAAG